MAKTVVVDDSRFVCSVLSDLLNLCASLNASGEVAEITNATLQYTDCSSLSQPFSTP